MASATAGILSSSPSAGIISVDSHDLVEGDAVDWDGPLSASTLWWMASCSKLPIIDFNDTIFTNAVGGCSPGQIWLMCKGANTSSACYNNMDLIDFSHHVPPKYAYPIYGIVFPVLVSLAVIANVFVLMVLSRKHMQSPTNAILLYMAVADLFVGIVPLPFTLFWFTLRAYKTPEILSPFWCYVYHYMMDTIPPVCHNVAVWLTVLLAAQRYVYIEHPLKAHYYCTVRDVQRAIIAIVLVSTLCGSMKLGDSFYETYSGYLSMDDGRGRKEIIFAPGLCVTTWSPLVHWTGIQKYYTIYFWMRAILFVWLPCGLLICLNIMLIRALHKAQCRRERLFSEGGSIRQRDRHKESLATSTMLVVIVSVFLLVNLPQGLFVALITIDQAFDLQLELLSIDGIAPLILMIDNMLIIATYPLNFAIYCSMSTLFRETFRRLFCANLPSLSASRRASSFGYGSLAPIGGTVVPVVQDVTAAVTVIYDTTSPRSDTALIQDSNGRMYVVKDEMVDDTTV